MIGVLLAVDRAWYVVPLIVVVSLVYSATRHEAMGPILRHAVRFAVWIVSFMALVLVVFAALSWLV
jgi:hypothetical protein